MTCSEKPPSAGSEPGPCAARTASACGVPAQPTELYGAPVLTLCLILASAEVHMFGEFQHLNVFFFKNKTKCCSKCAVELSFTVNGNARVQLVLQSCMGEEKCGRGQSAMVNPRGDAACG